LGDTLINQADFANYLYSEQRTRKQEDLKLYINSEYQKFVDQVCRAYEDHQLEKKYPEFRLLVKEYRDGILLFDLTDEVVWSKAIQDTTGLKAFHKQREDDYMWKERKEISIFEIDSLASGEKETAKLMKKIERMLKKHASDDQLKEILDADTAVVYTWETGKYENGANNFADQITVEGGAFPLTKIEAKPGGLRLIRLQKILPPEAKKLNEARGLITADYQNLLEKEWIEELRSKYTVDVDTALLQSLK